MKKLWSMFLVLLMLGQFVCAARADDTAVVSASGDADAGTVLLTGALPGCGGGELTVRIVSDGENPDVLYLNQITLPSDGHFALACPVTLPAGADAVYTLNCPALAQSLTGRVRMRMAFSELAVSGDAAGGAVSVSGSLTGQAGARVGVTVETATGRLLADGAFITDADGRFYGEIAVSLQAGDVLVVRFDAEMAKSETELTVVPGGTADSARLTDFSAAANESAGTLTVTGAAEPAGVRTLTLLVTNQGDLLYLNEFLTDENGAFALSFPAAFARGDRLVFRLNGAALEEGGEESLLIPFLFESVQAAGDAALNRVTFSGSIPGFSGGTVSAELTTATGRQLWRGSAATDALGAFSQSVPLALEEGDALYLNLSATDTTPVSLRFVVPRTGQPGTAQITELTVEPDLSTGAFLVSGRAVPAGARELTLRVSKAGSQIYLDQFFTAEDGSFSLRIPADMKRGDTFLFYFNGATLTESVEREVTLPTLPAGTGGAQTVRHLRFMAGYPDGSFRPDAGLTRAEAAMLFARLLSEDFDFTGSYDAGFSDVAADAWYADCIGYLRQEGLAAGYPDGTFRPDAPVTRAEFAALAVRFRQLEQAGEARFSDVGTTHWAYGCVGQAARQGWVLGYPDGSFRPESGITRAEATVLAARVLGRSCAETGNGIGADWQRFSDVSESHWANWDILYAANTHFCAA